MKRYNIRGLHDTSGDLDFTMMGLIEDNYRIPFTRLDPSKRAELNNALAKLAFVD